MSELTIVVVGDAREGPWAEGWLPFRAELSARGRVLTFTFVTTPRVRDPRIHPPVLLAKGQAHAAVSDVPGLPVWLYLLPRGGAGGGFPIYALENGRMIPVAADVVLTLYWRRRHLVRDTVITASVA